MSTSTPRLARAAFTDETTQALVAEVQQEYVRRYGTPDETPLDPGMFDAPRGAFFLAYPDARSGVDSVGHGDGLDPEVAVAMGGWRFRDDVHPWGPGTVAEVKRMYVAPVARRRGYARAVLRHLEDTARESGADVMVLETGTEQPEAIAMYVAAGYRPIASYGHYADSPKNRCFAKRLTPWP
jgi:ribosomal protein S18 acetylase RimI-like enzyme